MVAWKLQVMTRILAWALGLSLVLTAPAGADATKRLREGMELLRGGTWTSAMRTAGVEGSVGRDIIAWHVLRAGNGSAEEAIDFLARRPDWPGLDWLRAQSEAAVAGAGSEAVLAFYDGQPPQTPEGVLSHAAALIGKGRQGEAEAELVMSWRTRPMGAGIQADYLETHGALLAPHHAARLDRMLWDGQMASARQMLPLVDEGQRALAEARMALLDLAPGVDTRIAAVPPALQDDPGLAHARFVWRSRKDRTEDAVALLLERSTSAEALGEPGKWAGRRIDLARRDMIAGNPKRAYRIAAQHHSTPAIGYDYAELEWLAGFIALRLLNDPAIALVHFQRFDAVVDSPISKGRSGYWMGRAQAALGNADAAHAAYAMGAEYQSSFYGLLAAERIGRPFDPELAAPPNLPPWREAAFMNSSVLEAGLLLLAAGEADVGERFLTHLVESLDPVQAAQLGEMAIAMDRPHLAVMIAKRAAQSGKVLHAAYYPVHPVGRLNLPMAPEMTLAIARRESEFDPKVVSGAGAQGLMQVMPQTARAVAGDMGVLAGHSTDRLLSDWRYNAALGARYLAGLAGTFNGNVVMMAAGYNAGPGRPIRWMQTFGDPRGNDVDIVDWIEFIPFDETRNYVMRVTESLPVYRARLGKPALPVPFSKELSGATLRAFAP